MLSELGIIRVSHHRFDDPFEMSSLSRYLSIGSALLIVVPLSLFFSRPVSRIQYRYLGAAFVIFGVSFVLLTLPFAFPGLYVGHINWSGKTFSIIVVYTIILSRKKSDPARKFMTFAQRKGSFWRSLTLILLLALFSAAVTISGGDQGHMPIHREILAYEATLPGLDEEAVFRAAFLGYMLAAARGKSVMTAWSVAGPVLTSAILFGLIHALHVDTTLHMHFDIATFAITGAIGVGLAILMLDSGSILLPVVAHNLANCVGMLV